MPAAPVISFQHVTKRYPGVMALEDVTLDIRPGELHAIVGEDGAGKSTLMKCLSGVITDFEGQLIVHGAPVHFRNTSDAERAGISFIHQELHLVEQLSAAANIFLGREKLTRLWFVNGQTMERAASELLEQLECRIHPRQLVRQLRAGDQQLVEIAKALSLDTDILIMDEPTHALTEGEVARLRRVIGRLRARGVTILYISHKVDDVFRLADRITVMRGGQVIQTLVRSEATEERIMELATPRPDAGRGA